MAVVVILGILLLGIGAFVAGVANAVPNPYGLDRRLRAGLAAVGLDATAVGIVLILWAVLA